MTLNSPSVTYQEIRGTADTPIYVTGAPLEHGPLPAFFYFALAGDESLSLDPFNQVVAALHETPMRIFSLTLPGHGGNFDKRHAMAYWAKKIEDGETIIDDFIALALEQVDAMIAAEYIDTAALAAGGLSRGAYIATKLTAKHKDIQTLLGFAPLTTLETVQAFTRSGEEYSLLPHAPELAGKTIRYYMGNNDTLVGTRRCFDFFESLVEAANAQKIRSIKAELYLYPSIGFKGHGTPPEIFLDGAKWLQSQILKEEQTCES
jgi:predicted esterase